MISRQSRQFRNIDRDLFIQTLKSSGRLNSSGQKRGITSHKVQVVRRLDHLECVHPFSTIPSMHPKSANQSDQRKKAVGVCGSEGQMPVIGTAVLINWRFTFLTSLHFRHLILGGHDLLCENHALVHQIYV